MVFTTMKRLLPVLLLALIPSVLATPCWAQKASIYDCYVLENGTDGSGYIVLGIARDNDFIFKNRYLLTNIDAVKAQCRTEIAKFQSKDSKPIPVGKVDLSDPIVEPPPPPPPPTQDELDLRAFLVRVDLARKLAVVVPPDDKDLADLRTEIAGDLKAHPEWKGSL